MDEKEEDDENVEEDEDESSSPASVARYRVVGVNTFVLEAESGGRSEKTIQLTETGHKEAMTNLLKSPVLNVQQNFKTSIAGRPKRLNTTQKVT